MANTYMLIEKRQVQSKETKPIANYPITKILWPCKPATRVLVPLAALVAFQWEYNIRNAVCYTIIIIFHEMVDFQRS